MANIEILNYIKSELAAGQSREVITNVLAMVRQGALVDVGLPVVVGLPVENRIRPGEIVDLWIER